MSRFRLPLVLACLLVPSLIPAVGPDPGPGSKLSPAMLHLIDEDPGPYRVWIFLVDKGLTNRAAREEAIDRVAAAYNPRAVERRRLRGRHAVNGGPLFDFRDIPVHEPYVNQVASTGARVRVRSRWVNAVSAVATREQVEAIAKLPAVVKIQPVARSKRPEFFEARPTEVPGAPLVPQQLDYGRSTAQLTQINLIALHEDGYTGEGVIVGVLDTGFRRDHVAFNQPGHEIDVIAEYDFVDDDPDTSNQPGDPSSQHNHGTLILGTLASYYPGELVGGAYGASFALAKTEDTTGEYPAEEDNYVAGLEFLEANGADMTTSSLGYIDWYTQADLDGETAVTTIAVNAASDAGVHTVTAAGNEYHDTDPATSSIIAPADAFSVITSGAVTSSGSISSFSSDGPTADGRVKPELLALGSGTSTISSSSTTGFTTADGTSLSTPLVAAAVACLIQAHPSWTVEDMREALFTYADYDPGGLGFDPEYVRGYGIVDAMSAHVNYYTPAGLVDLNEDVYACNDTVEIALRDDNVPGDPPVITVEISSATEVAPETVTLAQIAPGAGRYSGTVPTTSGPPVNGDGALSVSHGDTLTVEYIDADDGAGGIGVLVTDTASMDCVPPVISAVHAHDVTGTAAWISWLTDEPSDSTVHHGLSPPGTNMTTAGEMVASHAVKLTGLQECSGHYYWVQSADAVGNTASENNGEQYYTFETGRKSEPEFDSADTPVPIADNSTQTSTISVADDETVLAVKVGINITHTYTGDLDITLISPAGQRVLLVADRGGTGENFSDTVFDDEAATPISSGAAPFTGSFRPEEPLGDATGISSLGDWVLEVVDDAGSDTGTLNAWTLILTNPAGACGPSATYHSHALGMDTCASGAGDGNGFWDSGEQIQFDLAIKNDGTDPLTGVTAQVVPRTAGVIMIDNVAGFGDIDAGASVASPTNYSAQLPSGLPCGGNLGFDVVIRANEGGWTGTFTQVLGEVIPGGSAVAWSEDFDAAGIPGDWTIVDGSSDGLTWFADDATDPSGCANTDPASPIGGRWAAVDSDCTGSGFPMDEELVTPPIDLTGTLGVTLEFDHYFNWLGPETADVDVRSTLTAGQWINVGRWTADTANPEHMAIDITAQAAGVADLQIRWHYYDADYEWFWYVDNVVLTYPTQAGCNMPECVAAPPGPPPVPDGSQGSSPLRVGRLDAAGSMLELDWDDQCSPVAVNLIYGPLSQVATYGNSGAVCSISDPEIWDPAPPGDLWFLLVGSDGAGTESSWGLTDGAERNGLTPSGTCATTAKQITERCP